MRIVRSVALFALVTGAAVAQPTITAVQNAASNIPAGLPNAGIAQGALFVVKGSGLGPATFAVASAFPFQTSIGGSSVRVTVSGTSVDGIMYYAGNTQVAAVLPSRTPAGAGTLTVTYQGRTSATAPITVLPSALGVFTVSQSGAGDAIATLGATFLTPANSANPGEIVVIWATGLGPVTFDETNAAQQSDMTNIPVEAFVGGRPARVVFRGRNGCCTAVDTIYIEIPAGVTGCVVPVVLKIGNIVSNTTTIPIAASGRVCRPTLPSAAPLDLSTILSRTTFSAGGVTLIRTSTTTLPITVGGITIGGETTRNDSAGGSFLRVTIPPGAIGVSSAVDIATFGSCTISTFSGSSAGVSNPFTFNWLDAGVSLGLTGPGGPRTLTKQTVGGIIAYSATLDMSGNYLNAGQYTVTGPGGPDIGAFSAQLTLPAPLTWTNQAAVTNVNRSAGVTVNWTGGDPAGYVMINGVSSTAGAAAAGASFTCIARTSDGTFTVPSVVLLALPASGTQSAGGATITIPGLLGVSNFSLGVLFQATGLDFGSVSSAVSINKQVVYQ